jgi:hypothetical protein
LVRDCEQERVCLRNRFVLLELLDQHIRLGCIGPAKDCPCGPINVAKLIPVITTLAKIGTIAVVYEREDAAADGNARSPGVTGVLPGCTKGTDLFGLLNVKRLTGLIEL